MRKSPKPRCWKGLRGIGVRARTDTSRLTPETGNRLRIEHCRVSVVLDIEPSCARHSGLNPESRFSSEQGASNASKSWMLACASMTGWSVRRGQACASVTTWRVWRGAACACLTTCSKRRRMLLLVIPDLIRNPAWHRPRRARYSTPNIKPKPMPHKAMATTTCTLRKVTLSSRREPSQVPRKAHSVPTRIGNSKVESACRAARRSPRPYTPMRLASIITAITPPEASKPRLGSPSLIRKAERSAALIARQTAEKAR